MVEENYAPGELLRLITRLQLDVTAFRGESSTGIEMLRREAQDERHTQANRLTEFLSKLIRLEGRVDGFERGMAGLTTDNEKMEGRIESLTVVIGNMSRKVDGMWNRAIGAGLVLGMVGWGVAQLLTVWTAHR